MKLKNATVLIIVFSAISLLSEIGSMIYIDLSFGLKERWLAILFTVLHAGILASIPGVAIATVRSDVRLQKAFALALIVLNAIIFGYLVYSQSLRHAWDMLAPLKFATTFLPQLQPVFVIVFAVMLVLPPKPGRIRQGAWWLMTGGIINCCAALTSIYSTVLHTRFSFSFEDVVFVLGLLGFLHIFYSIGLVVLAVALIRKENGDAADTPESGDALYDYEMTGLAGGDLLDVNASPAEVKAVEGVTVVSRPPAVIDWVADFLAIMIPLFGFGYLIWRGFTVRDRYRRNWAAGSLFLSIAGMFFYLFSLGAILDGYVETESLIFLFGPAIVVCLVVWGGMAMRIRDDHFNNHLETEHVPSLWTWVGRMLICAIPVIGLIMLIDWSLDREDDGNRRNWSRAMLIRMGFMLIWYFFLFGVLSEDMHWF